jgi:transketolase
MGDGELQEGQIWEAPSTPPTTKSTTSSAVDNNGQQIDGSTAQVGGNGDARR